MVFISHSSKDQATADAICAHLESAGINCWIAPRNIEAGANWTKGIMQGLEACRVLILVFSKHANDSHHVEREVAKAFSCGLAEVFRSSRQSCQIFPAVRFRGNSCPVGLIEPIETHDRDQVGSRYHENQRTSQ